MPASLTAIGNAALARLGQGGILSLDDEDDRARWIRSRIEDVRDLVLRTGRWHFAVARAQLPAEAVAPPFGFARQYPLPADCLQLVDVVGLPAAPGGAFALEGGRILTNAAAPLSIRYVRRVVDVAAWDPLFAEAVVCRLAMDLAEKLTQSRSRAEAAARDYQLALREAFRVNAIEAPPELTPDGDWLTVRS
ncbi:MAG: hypothetical protein QE280_06800 [Caulobacter sp.]|nr:hypothetical protein [Caulobacter sp.]